MAAFRERHLTRHGMGHADRPWLHNALSLDAQSRRVCVPAARCTHSDANTDCIAFGYAHGNSQWDADSYSDGNTCKGHTHAETASYATAAAIELGATSN